MKREMDLVRELLLKLEAMEVRQGGIYHIPPDAEEVQVLGYDTDQIDYHLRLIEEIGWLDTGSTTRPMDGITFRGITWDGHDFLDSVRDQDIWNKTKSGVMGAGGFTLELVRDLAKGFVKKQIEDRTGIKL